MQNSINETNTAPGVEITEAEMAALTKYAEELHEEGFGSTPLETVSQRTNISMERLHEMIKGDHFPSAYSVKKGDTEQWYIPCMEWMQMV